MNRSNWALLGFLAIAGFFLLTEHKAHVLGVPPFLLLLAYPLLHLFHRGGHGRHGYESKAPERTHRLAIRGPYARIRHPQYAAFVLIMLGFLVQWPTLLTLFMFPVLVWMYVRLARGEEHDVEREFGEDYRHYAAVTPAFFPGWQWRKHEH